MVTSMPRKLGGNRACGGVLPGLPTHQERELNAGAVVLS